MTERILWTDADLKLVKRMHRNGSTAAEISIAFPGRTRSAVCGIIRRMDLPKREQAQTTSSAQTKIRHHKEREKSKPTPPASIVAGPLGHEPFRFPSGEFVTLETVGDNYCRFPIGVPSEADFIFCGNQPQPGSPYCEPCHRRTHVAIKPDAIISDRDKAIIAANARKSGLLRALGG